MLNFRLFGFPVFVQPWFFLIMAIFGGAFGAVDSAEWTRVGLYVAAGFVSVLGHELGHAFLARRYGGFPQILLHGMGGLCINPNAQFTRSQNFSFTAAGPAVSFLLAVIAKILLPEVEDGTLTAQFLRIMIKINLVWGMVNLLPVLPLDGGHLLDSVMGPLRRGITRVVGGVTGALIAVLCVTFGEIVGAILFGAFAYENFTGKRVIH